MALPLTRHSQSRFSGRRPPHTVPDTRELVAFCPGCSTLETLWFSDQRLMQSRKFRQQGGRVFHDCGTPEPCRLYRPGWVRSYPEKQHAEHMTWKGDKACSKANESQYLWPRTSKTQS